MTILTIIKPLLKCGGFHSVHECITPLPHPDSPDVFNHGLGIDGDLKILYHYFLLYQRGHIHPRIFIR